MSAEWLLEEKNLALRYFGEQKPVFARSGWEIPQPDPLMLEKDRESEDLVRIRTAEAIAAVARNSQSAMKIRSVSSYLYDCVGLVFAHRRAWINIQHLSKILKEDGYRQVKLDQLQPGDVVVYSRESSYEHVGVVTCVHPSLGNIPNIRVLSKWGKDGEVEHGLTDVPYYLGEPTEYWSERVPHDIGQLFRGR